MTTPYFIPKAPQKKWDIHCAWCDAAVHLVLLEWKHPKATWRGVCEDCKHLHTVETLGTK